MTVSQTPAPSLDQQYSSLITQLTALNAQLDKFVNGLATDTITTTDGRVLKSLSGIIADLNKFRYVQKIVDQRLYSDMIAADATLDVGLIVRVWGDTPTVNGLYLKQTAAVGSTPGTYAKITYSTLYDLTQAS